MARLVLTDRFVQTVKASADGPAEFFDQKNPGLALRVSKGGVKAWSFVFTSPRDGRRARVALGTYPGTGLAAARTRWTEARAEVEAGRDPRDLFARHATSAMTVAGLVERYLEMHVRPHLRTAKEVERRFEKGVLPYIGDVVVAELHKRDVNRCIDPAIRRGSQAEAAHVFDDIRALLRWAVARGDLDHNPAEGMRRPATAGPRDRVLSLAEIRSFWAGLPKALARSKDCQRILKLVLVTAQRVGEVAGIEVKELDLEKRMWTLPAARSKNGHAHTIPLSPLAVEIIEEALKAAGDEATYLFPNLDGEGPLPAAAVARTVARAHEISEEFPSGRFGLAHFSSHDLRRTAVTGMAELGVQPIVLGHVVGHRSVTRAGVTLAVYSQYSYSQEKKLALNQWSDRLRAIVASDTPAKIIALGAA